MKFFIPGKTDEKEALALYKAIKAFAMDQMNREISEKRIFRLSYVHGGIPGIAEVGKPDPDTGEIIFAILESDPYLVCTPNRGVARGMPLLVGVSEVRSIIEFDE